MECIEEICEGAGYLLGASGECNQTSGECICPPGFSGLDDWHTYNSCTVNTDFSYYFKFANLILNGVNVFLSLLCIIIVSCSWGFLPNVPRKVSFNRRNSPIPQTATTTPKFSLFTPPNQADHEKSSSQRRVWRRKRDSLIGFTWFFMFAFTGLFYYIPFFIKNDEFPNGVRRDDIATRSAWAIVQNAGVAIAAPSLFAGFNYILVTWYNTLPSVRRYGALLGMNPLLVRYPKLVYNIAWYTGVFTFIVSILLLFLIPLIEPSLQKICDEIWLYALVFCIINYIVSINIVVCTLMKIFKDSINVIAEKGDIVKDGVVMNEGILLEAINTARILVIGTSVAFFVAIPSLIFLILNDRSVWFWWNVLVVVAHVTSLFLILLMAFRTSGGGAPREHRRNTQSSKDYSKDTGQDGVTYRLKRDTEEDFKVSHVEVENSL